MCIRDRVLSQKYGENWEIKGLPKSIYKRAKSVADERNYDSIATGDGSSPVTIWDCVKLKECGEIVTAGSHWTELFESILTRPEEEKIAGGKSAKTKWLERIDSLQNKLGNASYSVSTTEFEFIKSIHEWICKGRL